MKGLWQEIQKGAVLFIEKLLLRFKHKDSHIKVYGLDGTLGHKDKHMWKRLLEAGVVFVLMVGNEELVGISSLF